MSHLGSRLSAFVDGRLGVEEAERVMSHVAACAPCATELAGERQARRALKAARDVVPEPDLTARLLALRPPTAPGAGSAGASLAPVRRWSDSAGFAGSVPLPGERATSASGASLRGEVGVTRRLPALVGLAGCVAVLLAGLVALGDRPAVSPQVHRAYALRVLAGAVDTTARASGSSSAQVPAEASSPTSAVAALRRRAAVPGAPAAATDPLATPAAESAPGLTGRVVLTGDDAHSGAHEWLTRHGWVAPGELPPGWTIEAVRLDVHGPGDVEMDIEGPHGTVVVLQERGRLAADGGADLPTIDLGDRTVHLVARDPWHVVWQCDDVVVSVVAEGHATAVREVVAVHPAQEYDDGVPARISRGWAVLAGALAP